MRKLAATIALVLVGCSSTTNIYELAGDSGAAPSQGASPPAAFAKPAEPAPVDATAPPQSDDAGPAEDAGAIVDTGAPDAGDTGLRHEQPPPVPDAAPPVDAWAAWPDASFPPDAGNFGNYGPFCGVQEDLIYWAIGSGQCIYFNGGTMVSTLGGGSQAICGSVMAVTSCMAICDQTGHGHSMFLSNTGTRTVCTANCPPTCP